MPHSEPGEYAPDPSLSFRKVEIIEEKADSNRLHIESLADRLAALEKRFGIENVVDASAAAAGGSAMGGETLKQAAETRPGDMRGHATRHASFRVGGKETAGLEGKKPFEGEAFKMPYMPKAPCAHRFGWFGPDRFQCDQCQAKVSVEQARTYWKKLKARFCESVDIRNSRPIPTEDEVVAVLQRAWDTNPIGTFDHPGRGELISYCAKLVVEHIGAKGFPDANPTRDEGPVSG